MLSRCLGAAVLLFVLGGFVVADSITLLITKTEIKDGKGTITGKVFKKGEKKGEEKTFKVSADTKISKKGKGKDAEATTVKSEDFVKDVEKAASAEGKGKRAKGVFAKIETKDDTDEVTSITYGGRGKRGGKKNKTDE
jgi:hypothetical protein